MLKGQAAIETFIVVSVLLVIFLGFFFSMVFESTRVEKLRTYIHAKNVVQTLADAINLAVKVGPGYSVKISLPEKLYGNKVYLLNIYPAESRLAIAWDSSAYYTTIMTKSLSGAAGPGEILVLNINGSVLLQ